MRAFLIVLGLIITALVAGNYYYADHGPKEKYYTAKVESVNIIESVAVTGYAEPVEVRVVQAEAPGVVQEVLVDFNDDVKEGQTLARLSSDMQRVEFRRAETVLEEAKTSIKVAEAAMEAAQAGLTAAEAEMAAAERELKTAEENAAKNLIPAAKVEAQRDMVLKAKAGVMKSKSQVKQAEAGAAQAQNHVDGAKVALQLANLSLDKTELRSNMTGTVLNRDILVGDTVGRPKVSLTEGASALFEISAPLDRMRAIVKVSEADYSRVRIGQKANFTIDAYPDARFDATVMQVRNAPTSDRTAVSYATVLDFANRKDSHSSEWMVKPRSTVSADIEIRKADNVLAVPNSALLFTPMNYDEEIPSVKEDQRLVWQVGPGGKPIHRVIQVGITDGLVTQVLGGDLKKGDEIITGEPIAASPGFRLPSIGG